ncbi:hypothetical protein GW750_03085 [bacterium]|nr:hypothetical protein [bacterium]
MREKEDFDKTLNKQDASLKTILEKAKKLFLDLKAFPISRDKFLGKLNTHFQIEDKNEQTKLYNLINKIFDDTSLSKINLKDLVKEFNTKEDNPKEVEMLDKKHDIID